MAEGYGGTASKWLIGLIYLLEASVHLIEQPSAHHAYFVDYQRFEVA